MASILAANSSDRFIAYFLTCLVAMGLIVVLGIGVWYARRWQRSSAATDSSPPWTLDDLRKLREQGKLTETEFQTLRATMVEMCTRTAPPKAPAPQHQPRIDPERDVRQAEQEQWDWVAEDDPSSGGFDLKKPTPD